MTTLRESSGVRPRTGETAEMYIKRALTEQEQTLAHRAAGADIVRSGERALAESEAIRSRPLDESIKDYVDNNPGRVAEASRLHRVYEATRPTAEILPHIETVHSTDEAMEQLMPALMKRFPGLAKDGEGVQANVYANFLRTAKPEHFKALGLDGEDMQKYLGGGKIDAMKIATYLKGHHAGVEHAAEPITQVTPDTHGAVHEAVAAPKAPAHIQEAVAQPKGAPEVVHTPEVLAPSAPLSSTEVAQFEKTWDTVPLGERVPLIERMVPQYVEHEIAAVGKNIDVAHFMDYLHRLHADAIDAPLEIKLQSMPPEYAEVLSRLAGVMNKNGFTHLIGARTEHTTLYDYLVKGYVEKIKFDGPQAVVK